MISPANRSMRAMIESAQKYRRKFAKPRAVSKVISTVQQEFLCQ